jgi:nitrogen fixation protein NifU and related proteins
MNGLYQAALLAHAKKPYGAGRVVRGTEDGEALNTACGDEIRVALSWTPDGCLARLTHELHGCAVSAAAASLVAQRLEGKTRAEIAALASAFDARLGRTGFEETWGEFQVFNGIERFPARIHCAKLVWRAVAQALAKGGAS